ncbi:hypothetical protein BpHYR1_029837 [Brachionus plicatilis]|uniref:Uncharacterized protein n=1 Tax=Brachionus plicatilis TaxID=10195 RepID=A0A3M7PYH7_BRAPC|nr:hypothetical protein BpHYR1_029837 [Brachionus plicatilis]
MSSEIFSLKATISRSRSARLPQASHQLAVLSLQVDELALRLEVSLLERVGVLGAQTGLGQALKFALLGHFFFHLLGLYSVPLFQLSLLLLIQLLEVSPNVPDGPLELGPVELGRVEADYGLEPAQLGDLLLVHSFQKRDLLLEGLHLVLARHTVYGLLVQVVLELSELFGQAALLLDVLEYLFVQVVQLGLQVVGVLARVVQQTLQIHYFVLVRIERVHGQVHQVFELERVGLGSFGLDLSHGLEPSDLVDEFSEAQQLRLHLVLDLARVEAPLGLEVVDVGQQLSVHRLQRPHSLHIR